MATAILLSSSPPPAFARSPTPASSSPSLPSPSSLLRPTDDHDKTYKRSTIIRDGFSTGFTSAATLLQTRVSGVNIPVKKQQAIKVTKTYSSRNYATTARRGLSLQDDIGRRPKGRRKKSNDATDSTLEGQVTKLGCTEDRKDSDKKGRSPSGSGETIQVPSSPVLMEKATTRRPDWTPTKDTTADVAFVNVPSTSTTSLFSSFGYKASHGETTVVPITPQEGEGAPTKRRRVELVQTTTQIQSKPTRTLRATPKASAKACSKKSVKATKAAERRSISPKKKYTTITERATSHYFGDEPEAAPMLQYLSTAHASIDEISASNDKPSKTKRLRVSRPAKAAKDAAPPRRLEDPQSVLKALDSQELLFGTASQLERDDSPTLIRDTVQALKESEASSIVGSFSIGLVNSRCESNSTRLTTSKFAKPRNLWSAAGRNDAESEAQIDTVELINSPDLRRALAGPEQAPTANRTDQQCIKADRLVHTSPKLPHIPATSQGDWLDVDATTPKTASKTSTFLLHQPVERSGSNAPLPTVERLQQDTRGPLRQEIALRQESPTRPHYEGYTDAELANQLVSWGFKPKRTNKREKMIELLYECSEHIKKRAGQAAVAVPEDEGPDSRRPSHGEVLSSVYDLKDRPIPKAKRKKSVSKKDDNMLAEPTKKPRGRPKKVGNVTETRPAKKTPTKARTKAKSAATQPQAQATPSTVKKRKTKAKPALSNQPSKSDLIESSAEDKTPTIRAARSKVMKPKEILPVETVLLDTQTPTHAGSTEVMPGLSVTRTPFRPDIASQITKAITTFRACSGHDHQNSPTWHEKILMYDPIVLEDLALWLNTEGLKKVHEDREVGALEVREWCESKGVCCLWKGGWRGNGR